MTTPPNDGGPAVKLLWFTTAAIRGFPLHVFVNPVDVSSVEPIDHSGSNRSENHARISLKSGREIDVVENEFAVAKAIDEANALLAARNGGKK